MTKVNTAKTVPKGSRTQLLVFRALLIVGALLLIGGGVWYVAITGIVGVKKWDFTKYGLAPTLMAAVGGAILLFDLAAFFFLPWFSEASMKLKHDLKRDKYRYILIFPGLLVVFIFSYIPMYGVILAFKDFKIKNGIMFSQWCGLENFSRFFGRSVAGDVIWNTLFIGVTQLLITFPLPIILALLLN